MKTIFNLTLTIALFCSMVAAGDMGNGNHDCTGEQCPPPPPCTQNCRVSGPDTSVTSIETTDIIIVIVKDYLGLGV